DPSGRPSGLPLVPGSNGRPLGFFFGLTKPCADIGSSVSRETQNNSLCSHQIRFCKGLYRPGRLANKPCPCDAARISKRGFVPALGALSALTGVAISLFIPAQNEIARSLGVDAAAGTGLVSTYFLGYGIGQSVWGPLSDRMGRRGPLAVAMLGFILASIVC